MLTEECKGRAMAESWVRVFRHNWKGADGAGKRQRMAPRPCLSFSITLRGKVVTSCWALQVGARFAEAGVVNVPGALCTEATRKRDHVPWYSPILHVFLFQLTLSSRYPLCVLNTAEQKYRQHGCQCRVRAVGHQLMGTLTPPWT